jgi:thiamine biosynthesis lipoprotein
MLRHTFPAMGTTVEALLESDDERGPGALVAVETEFERLEGILSRFRPSSALSRLNRDGRIDGERELAEVVCLALAAREATAGRFDPTIHDALVTAGYDRTFEEVSRTGPADFVAQSHLGAGAVRVDGRAVELAPGVRLDLGGIGKGYAVDRMIEVLKRHGIRAALVSGGGSSVYGLGAPPEEPRGWRMEISAPESPDTMAAEVFLKDMSMSTSGSYEKFFYAGGRRYSHLMDPRTGYPARGVSAVSVVSPRTIDSEAWTKAVFINGRAWTATHAPRELRVFFCDDRSPKPACGWIR